MEKITISIIDPKVKGLLSELQNLGLIDIDDHEREAQKQELLEKLGGKNLLDIESSDLSNLLK